MHFLATIPSRFAPHHPTLANLNPPKNPTQPPLHP